MLGQVKKAFESPLRDREARGPVTVFTETLSKRRQDQPRSGDRICDDLALYHDAESGLFSWRQTLDQKLALTCYQFHGTYLSLALGTDVATRTDIERSGQAFVKIKARSSRPVTTFLRLNLVADGVKQTLHETVICDTGDHCVAFDLDGLPNVSSGVTDVWLDAIFAEPEMSEILLTDLRVYPKRPAA